MIKISAPKFLKTYAFMERIKRFDPIDILHAHGKMGVAALAKTTPKDTGEAASSWGYKIVGDKNRYRLIWTNSVVAGKVPLVIILQYGHGTKGGGWVAGRDFINPALNPVYESIEKAILKEVVK